MIKNKVDYRNYIESDKKILNRKQGGILNKLFHSENYYIHIYLETLRRLEYLANTKKTLFHTLYYYYTLYKFKKISFKLQITIPINVCGPGINIGHIGNIIVNRHATIGANCTFNPGVIVGQKDSPENVPLIGDNVYLGAGVKVIGRVVIGNNVTVAPNSVVIKDIPDDCVVSGVPAKIIKRNGVKVAEHNI